MQEKEKATHESGELYPTKIELETYIGDDATSYSRLTETLYQSTSGVRVVLTVDRNSYSKEDVAISVKRICQKLIECFC